MKWNWQQPDWPKFRWESVPLAALEGQFLQQSGILIGSVKHLTDDDRAAVTIDIMTGEALKTSEIEGELLNRDSVQSSLRREFGLDTSDRRIPPAERGIAEMMIALSRDFADPLTNETLFAWNEMVVSGRRDIDAVGRYRDHEDAMQVVSGLIHKPTVHFEAPPSKDVPEEMQGFLDWFTSSSPGGATPLPALTRAGIAHLYFISIHPFEDGNGNKRNEITGWLTYFAQTVLEAQEHSLTLIDFLLAKVKFYDRFRDQMNERQARVIARMFREGIDGFTGGLSAANYITITGTSRATATRDLHELVAMGALTQMGMLKSTRYQLAIA